MTREAALQIAKPILFNTEMVFAINKVRETDRKTVTRRVLTNQDKFAYNYDWNDSEMTSVDLICEKDKETYALYNKAPCRVGDVLYVRETWQYIDFAGDENGYVYKASENGKDWEENTENWTWKPSIHMPKAAARIFLRVTDVSVEQLQDIITGDYKTPLNINREGLISPCSRCTHNGRGECKDYIAQNSCVLVDEFVKLWDSTVKKADLNKYGWAANPWVWVISFERLEVAE